MRVIAGTFRHKPISGREPASSGSSSQESSRHSCVTWGNLATFVVGCTIVGTALFLGSRIGGSP
jgi:hypothetical protein